MTTMNTSSANSTSEDETLSSDSYRMMKHKSATRKRPILPSGSIKEDASNVLLAARTCRSCKKRKKRCDKLLPSCSSCKATRTVCEYKDDTISPEELRMLELQRRLDVLENMLMPSERGEYPVGGHAILLNKQTLHDPHAGHPLLSKVATRHLPDDIIQFAKEFVSQAIEEYGLPSEPAIKAFFDEVQQWLPIVDEESFKRSFQDAGTIQHADRSLLFLAIYLLGQPPRTDRVTEQSILHRNTRGLFQYLSKKLLPSVELIQSALLLATYEYTRGLAQTAYTTISTAATLAHAIGLPSAARRHCAQYDGPTGSSINSSHGNLWWAIVILDRFINIEDELHDQPFVSQPVYVRPSKSFYDQYETGLGLVEASTNGRASYNIERQAQACELLSRVFEFCSRADAAANESQMASLDLELKNFLSDILQDCSARWGMMSAATALWNLAFITLHDSSLLGLQGSSLVSMDPRSSMRTTLSLNTATRIIIDLVQAYNDNKLNIPPASVSPGCAFTVYKAGVLHLRSYLVANEQWWGEFNSIRQFCWYFGQRWPLAAKYLKLLENEASRVIPAYMRVTESQ